MTGRSVRRLGAAVVGAGALVGALGVGSSALAASHDVAISGFAFSPSPISVKVGDTVTWTNSDNATHTATADGGSFDTGNLGTGASGTVTFSTAGSFKYHCNIHRGMSGTVVVTDAVAAPATDTDTVAGRDGDGPALGAALLGAAAVAGFAIALRRFGSSRAGRATPD